MNELIKCCEASMPILKKSIFANGDVACALFVVQVTDDSGNIETKKGKSKSNNAISTDLGVQ